MAKDNCDWMSFHLHEVKLCCGIGHIVVCFCFGEGKHILHPVWTNLLRFPLEPEVRVLQVSDNFNYAVNNWFNQHRFLYE